MSKLVIIIPARNEERMISSVIKRIPKRKLPKTEIVVINDGSTDKTAQAARKAGAKVINFSKNRGLARVFRAGVEYALSRGADYIVNIDADGQHLPEKIPDILKPVRDGKADLVIGSRLMKKGNMKSRRKQYANRFLARLISLLIKKRIYDSTSGFRAFTREVAEKVKIFPKYTYTQQQLIQAAYNKFEILEVPIPIIERKEGKSKLVKGISKYAYSASQVIFISLVYCYPAKFFGLIGSLFVFFGILIDFTIIGRDLLSTVLVLSGIQFILFGMLFEILKKTK